MALFVICFFVLQTTIFGIRCNAVFLQFPGVFLNLGRTFFPSYMSC